MRGLMRQELVSPAWMKLISSIPEHNVAPSRIRSRNYHLSDAILEKPFNIEITDYH